MNWMTAWYSMKQGLKVRRHHWKPPAYWEIRGTELLIHTKQGHEINFREVANMGLVVGSLACDDWEVVEDEDVREESV